MTHDEYMEAAKKVETEGELIEFIKVIKSQDHTYDTIVHACYAAMKAAFNVVNKGPQGGISGFQAGFIGWMAVQDFMSFSKDAPLRILDYSNLLFPQYSDKFEKTINQETWDQLQKKAKENLTKNIEHTNGRVLAHWQSIADGNLPFGFQVKEQ